MKVLFFDIETSLNEGRFWRPGPKVNLSYKNITKERQVICAAWKWRGEKKIYSEDWGFIQQDKRPIKRLVEAMNEADICVAHNGGQFDVPWIRGRVLFYGLSPMREVRLIDTYPLIKRHFNLNSYRLDYIGDYLGLGCKIKTDYDLWDNVMNGDESALKKMVKYNKRDTELLEQVFEKITPHVRMPIHLGDGSDPTSCPRCGSTNTRWDSHRTATKIVYRCRKCKEPDCRHFWRTSVRA